MLLWYAFCFVFQGAQASGYGLVVLTMVSGGVKRYRSGNKVTEGQKKILAQKMNKSKEDSDCKFNAFL